MDTLDASRHISLVDRFYRRLWNDNARELAPSLLHPDLSFRGAIGLEKKGIDGFLSYMDTMQATFPDFDTEVVSLSYGQGPQVISRQIYRGTHMGAFHEVPATGRQVEYAGVGFFSFEDGLIHKVWVLGDLLAVYRQLGWRLAPGA
ncbi:ester cyclase [Orrella sp. JC864]|uniref:ester cyclase n=1 Tax=Orrella sp. JC864 TaxID=3120298 RepID=UPI00300959AB